MCPSHTRHNVILAALGSCPPGSHPNLHVGNDRWEEIARRLIVLAKLDVMDAARMTYRFGPEIGQKLDSRSDLPKSLDGKWITLLGKILDSVVSPKMKREHLSVVTCEHADFPALLAVIHALAYGSPSEMWVPSTGGPSGFVVGMSDTDPAYGQPGKPEAPPESHHQIAARTWYRPQLAMLATSLWPMSLGLEYYGSTLCHIMNPYAPCIHEEIIEAGMIMPPDTLTGVL